MKASRLLIVVGLLLYVAGSASAQSVTLEFKDDGRVKLVTENAPVSMILAEWARRGKTTIVNGERVPGPPATLQLVDVYEQEALDVVLRGVSGYLGATRETPTPGLSSFDRILILPTSRVTSTASVLPPPQPTFQPQVVEDDDDGPPPVPGQRVPPNLPPGVRLPQQEPNRLPPPDEPGEARPAAPAPTNPFGVVPGSATPGVVTPVPRPPQR
jgi:hypothetical protein